MENSSASKAKAKRVKRKTDTHMCNPKIAITMQDLHNTAKSRIAKKERFVPTVGLEPTTTRSKKSCALPTELRRITVICRITLYKENPADRSFSQVTILEYGVMHACPDWMKLMVVNWRRCLRDLVVVLRSPAQSFHKCSTRSRRKAKCRMRRADAT